MKTRFSKFDLGVHTGSSPQLARFIESTPLGTLIEDVERGVRHMVHSDDFVPLTEAQREAYDQGCPRGEVAKIGGDA